MLLGGSMSVSLIYLFDVLYWYTKCVYRYTDVYIGIPIYVYNCL